jgi:hypothetical protein
VASEALTKVADSLTSNTVTLDRLITEMRRRNRIMLALTGFVFVGMVLLGAGLLVSLGNQRRIKEAIAGRPEQTREALNEVDQRDAARLTEFQNNIAALLEKPPPPPITVPATTTTTPAARSGARATTTTARRTSGAVRRTTTTAGGPMTSRPAATTTSPCVVAVCVEPPMARPQPQSASLSPQSSEGRRPRPAGRGPEKRREKPCPCSPGR